MSIELVSSAITKEMVGDCNPLGQMQQPLNLHLKQGRKPSTEHGTGAVSKVVSSVTFWRDPSGDRWSGAGAGAEITVGVTGTRHPAPPEPTRSVKVTTNCRYLTGLPTAMWGVGLSYESGSPSSSIDHLAIQRSETIDANFDTTLLGTCWKQTVRVLSHHLSSPKLAISPTSSLLNLKRLRSIIF